jgi:hypothetical protein
MNKNNSNELPIRSKLQMVDDIVKTISHLHRGERLDADQLLEDLKTRALFLDEEIQQATLIFAEQISFQFDYDPYHKVTPEVQKAADKLIENLGFSKP